MKILAALTVAGLLLAACGGSPETQATQLEIESGWVATDLNYGSGLEPTVPERRPTLFFDGTRMSGDSGCNSFFGSYAVDGEQIRSDSIAMTMMFCTHPEEVMEQERRLGIALDTITAFKIADGTVTRYDADGTEVLKAEPAGG